MSGGQRRRACRAGGSQQLAFLHGHFLVVQVVRHGDDKKQDDQGATHRDELLSIIWPSSRALLGAREVAAQQRKSRKRQTKPDEIESQFHDSESYVKHSSSRAQQGLHRIWWPQRAQPNSGAWRVGISECGWGRRGGSIRWCWFAEPRIIDLRIDLDFFGGESLLDFAPRTALVDAEWVFQALNLMEVREEGLPGNFLVPRFADAFPFQKQVQGGIKKVRADVAVLVRKFQAIDRLVVQDFFAG